MSKNKKRPNNSYIENLKLSNRNPCFVGLKCSGYHLLQIRAVLLLKTLIKLFLPTRTVTVQYVNLTRIKLFRIDLYDAFHDGN